MHTRQPNRLALVVADAPAADLSPLTPLLSDAELRVAADGGARHYLQAGLLPNVAIGDFDSLAPAMLDDLVARGVRVERYPADKNETDLELALLYAVQAGATRIVVLAALGGRPDQHLANLQLLTHPALADLDVRMLDRGWEVFAVHRGALIAGKAGQIVSLLPMSEHVEGIVTTNLYYPLDDEPLHLGPARGVSNVMTGTTAHVKIRSGVLLVMHDTTDT
jgi:thiamine pyrophosphokinase